LDSYGNRRFYGVNDKKEGISYIMDNNKQRLCHAVKHLTPGLDSYKMINTLPHIFKYTERHCYSL